MEAGLPTLFNVSRGADRLRCAAHPGVAGGACQGNYTIAGVASHWLTWIGWMAWSAAISWIVLRPLIASMVSLALNSGLWVRRLLIGRSPLSGVVPRLRG